MTDLRVISGGAAQGLVTVLAETFRARAGVGIAGTFGAVGAMRAKLDAGDACDLVILTSAIVKALAAIGKVDADSLADIGRVETALAVRSDRNAAPVTDSAALRSFLMEADEIYFPDSEKSTAGIHFAGVLKALGIDQAVAGKLRTFPNGTTAMAELARSNAGNPVGCTQVTEIVATSGIRLVSPLPSPHALATIYTAGIVSGTGNRNAARILIDLLTGPEHADIRRRCGFI